MPDTQTVSTERFAVIFGRCNRCHTDYIKHIPLSEEFPDEPCECGLMSDHG